MSAVDKTLNRVHQRIKNHEFYEAHQAVRTVVARYVRSRDFASAIGLLYSSALLLSKADQTGSASDLVMYLIKVYESAGIKPDGPSRGRVAEIVWHLDYEDSAIKQIGQKAMSWSHHDAELAHVFGTILVRALDVYEAEKYLLQGTRDSAILLAEMHLKWAETEAEAATRSLIYSRGVFGYLSANNLRGALIYWRAIQEHHPDQNPISEYLDLLVKTCQTKDANLYRQLNAHYRPTDLVPAWKPAIQRIELDFFLIVPNRQFNLMDMMTGMMK